MNDDVNPQVAQHLRRTLTAVADTTPRPIPIAPSTANAQRPGRERLLVRAATVALLVGGVGGIIAVTQHRGTNPATGVPMGSTSPDDASADSRPLPTQVSAVVEQLVENDDLPEEQRQYFEDGIVTLAEYQEAYGAFLECAEDEGVADSWNEVGRDEVTGVITYTITDYEEGFGQPGSRLDQCYNRWWRDTEIAFQTSDPTVLAQQPAEQMAFFDENLRPCLEEIGVVVPDDLEFQDENWAPLMDEAWRAIQDGRCVVE